MNIKILALLALISVPVRAATAWQWALVDDNGQVVQVIVADVATILNRPDGPWVKVFGKVGIGYHYDGLHFQAPPAPSNLFVVPDGN